MSEVEMRPDEVRLLRFGAVTRNAHRIHYDAEFARAEGLDRQVVMAQLHGCLLYRAASDVAGDGGVVRELGWRNRAPAYAGDRLVVTAVVRESARPGELALELVERRARDGVVCCEGHAVVAQEAAGRPDGSRAAAHSE